MLYQHTKDVADALKIMPGSAVGHPKLRAPSAKLSVPPQSEGGVFGLLRREPYSSNSLYRRGYVTGAFTRQSLLCCLCFSCAEGRWVTAVHSQQPYPGFQALRACCQEAWLSFALRRNCPHCLVKRFTGCWVTFLPRGEVGR